MTAGKNTKQGDTQVKAHSMTMYRVTPRRGLQKFENHLRPCPEEGPQ